MTKGADRLTAGRQLPYFLPSVIRCSRGQPDVRDAAVRQWTSWDDRGDGPCRIYTRMISPPRWYK